VKTVFQFQLGPRQGDLSAILGERPVNLPKSFLEESVVGGNEVEENSYPWMAALGSRALNKGGFRWFCGGSLISKNMILTAAHCVQNSDFPLDMVRLGAHNLGESAFEDVDDYTPKQVIVHPDYKDDGSFPEHDIAVIVLQTEGREVKINTQILISISRLRSEEGGVSSLSSLSKHPNTSWVPSPSGWLGRHL